MVSKIADVLDVSLDFLLCKVAQEVERGLLNRMLEVQLMDEDDKTHILYTIDALIKNVKFKAIA